MGVVERIANRGYRVGLPLLSDIVEVLDVRGVIEGHAAWLAASNAEPEHLTTLLDAVSRFRFVAEAARGGEGAMMRAEWHRANSTFHSTVFDAAGNTQLRATSDMLHHKLPRNSSWLAMRADPLLLAQNANEHEGIALAIERRDAERARELAIAHMHSAGHIIYAYFEGEPTGTT
jgi:DNA-binding GntR family transcriptional regulator